MAKQTLSIEKILAVKPSRSIQEVKHPEVRGLYLRVHPSGRRSWCLRYSLHYRDRRMDLGDWPGITAEQAKTQAQELLGAVGRGENPAETLAAKKARRLTLAQFAHEFIARHCASKKPRTLKDYSDRIERDILPDLGGYFVGDIGLATIAAWHHKNRAHPFSANRALAVLSIMLSKAMAWGIREIGENPCSHVERYPEPRRHRYLTVTELGRLGRALNDAQVRGEYPITVLVAIMLGILTGMRPSEVMSMPWAHLDLKTGTLQLPEHKTQARGPRVVLLPPEAVKLLRQVPRQGSSPFVFAGRGKTGTIGSSVTHAWQEIRKAAKLPDVRLYDLRHTFISHGVAQGKTLAQMGQLAGHSTPATTSRYSHLVEDTQRENAVAVAGTLSSALKPKKAKKKR